MNMSITSTLGSSAFPSTSQHHSSSNQNPWEAAANGQRVGNPSGIIDRSWEGPPLQRRGQFGGPGFSGSVGLGSFSQLRNERDRLTRELEMLNQFQGGGLNLGGGFGSGSNGAGLAIWESEATSGQTFGLDPQRVLQLEQQRQQNNFEDRSERRNFAMAIIDRVLPIIRDRLEQSDVRQENELRYGRHDNERYGSRSRGRDREVERLRDEIDRLRDELRSERRGDHDRDRDHYRKRGDSVSRRDYENRVRRFNRDLESRDRLRDRIEDLERNERRANSSSERNRIRRQREREEERLADLSNRILDDYDELQREKERMSRKRSRNRRH